MGIGLMNTSKEKATLKMKALHLTEKEHFEVIQNSLQYANNSDKGVPLDRDQISSEIIEQRISNSQLSQPREHKIASPRTTRTK